MDFKSGNFPVGVVLFGLIALFLALRLRSVLGKRTGLDAPPGGSRPNPALSRDAMPPRGDAPGRRVLRNPFAARERAAEPETVAVPTITASSEPTRYVLPEGSSSAGQALTTLRAHLPNFDADAFLRGAERAFRRVVAAFAAGDRATLRQLLAPTTYEAFDQVIGRREADHETQHADIRHIGEVALVGAQIGASGDASGTSLDVRFISDQVSYVTGPDGHPVSGADAVTELSDVWTFEAAEAGPDAAPGGPAWRIAATRTA